jgi:hypothetical protein
MRGLITNREITLNACLTGRELGLRCLRRCLLVIITGDLATFVDGVTR